MSISIVLTDKIRVHPYFSDFTDATVSVPNKPFIQEILGESLPLGWSKSLSIQNLQQCITTCIYFGLSAIQFTEELFWKISERSESFETWFEGRKDITTKSDTADSKLEDFRRDSTTWFIRPNLGEPLRSELVKNWGRQMNRRGLIQLGARFLMPTYKEITASGNLKLLRWVREESTSETKPYVWNQECFVVAARGGHVEILKYLHTTSSLSQQTAVNNACPWGKSVCSNAAAGKTEGHLACLRYAHENGCPWDIETCTKAAIGGSLICLKYAHENGCAWNTETCIKAAGKGNLMCLKYAHENGCSWNTETCSKAAGKGNLMCLKYAHTGHLNETTSLTSEGGNVSKGPRWEGGGCPWNKYTCSNAASGGTSAHLACLQYAHKNGCPWDVETCTRAAGRGSLICLKYAHENGCPWNKYTCSNAARGGHLECLSYAFENGCPWDEKTCASAASGGTAGHLACLKYARQNGCPWDGRTIEFAAKNSHLACLKYMFENGWLCTHRIYYLVAGSKSRKMERRRNECLEYLHENEFLKEKQAWKEVVVSGNLSLLQQMHRFGVPLHPKSISGSAKKLCAWNTKSCYRAANGGTASHLEILKYLHQNGCPWSARTCSNAARGKTIYHLECLKYAHAGCLNETTSLWEGGGCPWDERTCSNAAREGSLECLQYAHENGCPWDKSVCWYAAAGGTAAHLECLKYVHTSLLSSHRPSETLLADLVSGVAGRTTTLPGDVCPWDATTCLNAAYGGHLECLQYVHTASEGACRWDARTCLNAAYGGHLECLKYAHQNGCPLDERTCLLAAQKGHLECLKYAHQNGSPLNTDICSYAAGGGHLECLKYAYQNGAPVDAKTCSSAARGGHLECLKYAHTASGLHSLDADMCLSAVQGGHLECLKYVHENGSPWNEYVCDTAVRVCSLPCLRYAHENGCPWNWGRLMEIARSNERYLECRLYLEQLRYCTILGAIWCGRDT